MSNVLKFKRSSTAGSVPTTSNLVVGEPAYNSADGLIYMRDNSDNILVFEPRSIYAEKTASFTASFGYIYDLHNTTNIVVTLPTWEQGRCFKLTLDGDAKNHSLTFEYRTGEELNGTTADLVASTKDTGDLFIINAMGNSGDKHWSISRIPSV